LEYASDDEEDAVTDASYQTPPMASTSPATIPPEAVVEVPTPVVTCGCSEVVEKDKDEELVLCSEVDAVGSDSSEGVVPEENVVPLPVAAPPPTYSPVRGQVALRGRAGRSFRPYRFPYTERVDRRLARKDLLGEVADSEHRRLKRKWGGEDLARNVRARVVQPDDQLESSSGGLGSSPGSSRGPTPDAVQRVDSPVV